MAGALAEFWSGDSTREVLLLVPELLFLAFTAFVALYGSFGFVASLLSDRRSHLKQERNPTGEARLRRPFAAAQLLNVVGAATVVPVLLLSLKVVLEAPVKVVIMAAAASAATVVAVVVASVAVLWCSGLVLARICQKRYQESK